MHNNSEFLSGSNLTPMLKQYLEIKNKHRDKILFFRMGDFYEMFFDDAIIASKILNIALTSRHKESNIPMAGIPYHALKNYTQKLLENGYKIAICEQIEDPKKAKKIVKREVVKILTPSINSEIDNLELKENYYLLVIVNNSENNDLFDISLVDFSDGDFFYDTKLSIESVISEIEKHLPKEVLIEQDIYKKYKKLFNFEFYNISFNFISDDLKKNKENKISNYSQAVIITNNYILENNKFFPPHIKSPEKLKTTRFLNLDENVISHLEILKSADSKKEGSLYFLLDNCFTSMGSRKLKKWLAYPLIEKNEIEKRYDFIEELINSFTNRNELINYLKNINDIERLNTKLALKTILPEELLILCRNFYIIKQIKSLLNNFYSELAKEFSNKLIELDEFIELIEKYILPEPSNNMNDGDYINSGINKELDEFREIKLNSKKWLLKYETELQKELKISNLKIKYNKVFGYFIEISKKNISKIPDNFIRKQTLVGVERYISSELKEFEDKILIADEKIKTIQKKLYGELLNKINDYCIKIKNNADIISSIDIVTNFAKIAIERDYKRPKINTENFIIKIEEGKHPILEIFMKEEFIPNDLEMSEKNNIYIITGPNMAGKSTFMRQCALLIIMAQIGSFVPAEKMEFSIIKNIFTRIGAKDRILSGESTFMVEMTETSKILKNIDDYSFIILDEIGRGTSTFDGISIAWAIVEYLASLNKKIFVLFATHYHELTKLEGMFNNIKNFSVNVKEAGEKLIFLRKIKPGPSDKSYGVEVARLAQIPNKVINRAKEILFDLENQQPTKIVKKRKPKTLFDIEDNNTNISHNIFKKISTLNIESMTPLQALNILAKLKEECLKKIK